MKPDFLLHLQKNWPLAVIVAGLMIYIPIALVSGVFYTNQGWIARSNEPDRYWRWVLLFCTLLAVSLAALFGSYYLGKAR
jgi:Na+/H+ antiporter NhaD/arsenite permease-like protein